MRNASMTRFHAAGILLFAASAGAQIVVTGDTRTVTEPVFPPVCAQLSAGIAQVNNDIPTFVDATITNPDAARIQAALNSCSVNSPGQAVELSMDSTGILNAFLSGPLVMPPNTTLLVDPGVTLFFSRNAQDFDVVQGTHTCGTRNGNSANKSCLPPIDIPKASVNVGIMGFGKLNARGGDPLLNGFATAGFAAPATYTWWNIASLSDQQVPESMIQPESGVTNLTLYKITLQNASMFHVKSIGSISGLTAWDVKIETPTFTNNTDGIDPDQAQNVTVANSWISDGDDDIAIGSSGTPGPTSTAENISIINNHFYAGHGESIGSFTDAGVNNILFDNNMLAGDDFSGKGSAINATAMTVGTTTFPVHYADGNSTAVRIKSDQAAGGLVTNVKYSNSCFLDHNKDLLFTPLYNTDTGSNTPNVYNILLQNLAFMNDANSTGTVQFTGTNTVVGGVTIINPLQITLDNVTFPSALTASKFTNTGSAGTEQYAQLTYGPGDVSANFIADWQTFVNVAANNDTVTNNITAPSLNPPTCNFTYIAPELTGPTGRPQTVTFGNTATAVVILTPAVALAAYPTGTVTLTDALTGNTAMATLPGNGDTIFVPLPGLSLGAHAFTATYSGDANYPPPAGQAFYSSAGPYTISVVAFQPPVANPGPTQTVDVGTLVTLTGTASSDPNFPPLPLTFQWSQTSGPTVVLTGASTATPTFTPLLVGTYVFSLVVNDGTANSSPVSVTVNVVTVLPTANIWVTDGDGSGTVRVVEFNNAGVFLSQFTINGGGRFPFGVAGMAIAPSGNFLITDSANKSVSAFSSTGGFIGSFGGWGTGNGQFTGVAGIAVDASGNIWVVDAGNNRVEEFNSSGAYLSQFGSVGSGGGHFLSPDAIAVDGNGNIWVTDGNGSGVVRVEEFNSSGTFLSQFTISGGGRFPFGAVGMAIAPSGNFLITDSANKNVSAFSGAGAFLGSFGGWGTANGQSTGIQGIAADSNSNAWVVDVGNDRVQEFNSAGGYLSQFGSVGSGHFSSPHAIVIH